MQPSQTTEQGDTRPVVLRLLCFSLGILRPRVHPRHFLSESHCKNHPGDPKGKRPRCSGHCSGHWPPWHGHRPLSRHSSLSRSNKRPDFPLGTQVPFLADQIWGVVTPSPGCQVFTALGHGQQARHCSGLKWLVMRWARDLFQAAQDGRMSPYEN